MLGQDLDEQLQGGEQAIELFPDDSTLLSILLCNHKKPSLQLALESVFCNQIPQNFEVIICDDSSTDGAWDIACEFSQLYDEKVTLCKQHMPIGKKMNRKKGLLMCKGTYVVEVIDGDVFDYEYSKSTISRLKQDKYYTHSYIKQLKPGNFFIPQQFDPILRSPKNDRVKNPLVSICVYNYNYGRYLRQCLQSVVEQTYSNIEVCFSDNGSTDESWDIALEFAKKYPDKFNLTRNRTNFGPNVNLWNCVLNMTGKYVLKLCSDDAIKPGYIERCVELLERHPDAGFAMVHRDIMDENGVISNEAAFYSENCLIPGNEQSAVYMVSSVNPSVSQVFYKVEYLGGKRMSGNLNDRWFGDRIMDFHITCERPIVYIKEPLLLNRVHSQSDGSALDGNLLQCVGEYVLVHQLSDIAANYHGMEKAQKRLPEALEKLSNLSIRYCLRRLLKGDENGAKRYFYFALAADLNIDKHAVFPLLTEYWSSDSERKVELLSKIKLDSSDVLTRKVSYPPPEGSIQYFYDGDSYATG
ncbi:MAG TPA: glycosyltransferase [Methylophaga aminisulfidivorans]|uniref:Glycosyltransferase n=1 Tax=Methylophaga aminisulfidivorans TaxID=230105 RepID=A0A7C1ZV49_9GAMM|nr:glycosyltransferase [Methylophaga aminisulfidivorans]